MVLHNPGDGRFDMVIRAVVHFVEAASKKCRSAAGICKLLAALSGVVYRPTDLSHVTHVLDQDDIF